MRNQNVRRTLERRKFESALAALAGSVAGWTEQGDRRETAIRGLSLFKREGPTQPVSGMYVPGICLAVQGAKTGSARQGILYLRRPAFLDYVRGYPVLRPDHPSQPAKALPGPKAQIRSPRDFAADDGQKSPAAARNPQAAAWQPARSHCPCSRLFSD